MSEYQILLKRDDGTLTSEGCWGGDEASFPTLQLAETAARELSELYPSASWVIVRNLPFEQQEIVGMLPAAEELEPKEGWDPDPFEDSNNLGPEDVR